MLVRTAEAQVLWLRLSESPGSLGLGQGMGVTEGWAFGPVPGACCAGGIWLPALFSLSVSGGVQHVLPESGSGFQNQNGNLIF